MAKTAFERAIGAADRTERAAKRTAIAANDDARREARDPGTWTPPAPPPKPPLTGKQRQRVRKAQKLREDEQLLEATVPAAALENGHYRVQLASGPSIIEDGQERVTTSKVVMNRGGTAVDRWLTTDRTGQFGLPQQYAIRFVQNLWMRAEGQLRAVDLGEPRVDAPLGWSQHEALSELEHLKGAVPRPYWEVFENVCRFDEEAGVAGSKLASNRRSAVDAAKTTVAFVASIVAMRKGF